MNTSKTIVPNKLIVKTGVIYFFILIIVCLCNENCTAQTHWSSGVYLEGGGTFGGLPTDQMHNPMITTAPKLNNNISYDFSIGKACYFGKHFSLGINVAYCNWQLTDNGNNPELISIYYFNVPVLLRNRLPKKNKYWKQGNTYLMAGPQLDIFNSATNSTNPSAFDDLVNKVNPYQVSFVAGLRLGLNYRWYVSFYYQNSFASVIQGYNTNFNGFRLNLGFFAGFSAWLGDRDIMYF